jgi:hypothetical protein
MANMFIPELATVPGSQMLQYFPLKNIVFTVIALGAENFEG